VVCNLAGTLQNTKERSDTMKKTVFQIFLLSLISISCNDRDLGDGYFYLPKYESIDIGYPNCEAILYKSTAEYVFSNVRIRGDVIEVKSNSKYIIVKRDPLIEYDKNTGIIEYYVLLKDNDSLIGPLNKILFEKKIDNLNIKLKLQ
ncbi:hypothetical protein, partial [uncultured Carboxylicivirga sp.]|uniref:hypothetical protein n=1 Tax=uncultured Carboxylicivirga sp. TaxID=1628156 RepID=UPI00259764AC